MLALVSTACCVTICRKPYKTVLYYIHMKVEMMHLVIELCVCLSGFKCVCLSGFKACYTISSGFVATIFLFPV